MLQTVSWTGSACRLLDQTKLPTETVYVEITDVKDRNVEALGRLAQANTAPQQVAVSEAQVSSAGARIAELQAAVDQAELELSYTKILAPESGRVTRKAVEVGALVQVGQPLMAIVPGDVWVTANFKESQIGRIRPGQPVDLSVDAYPDKVFKGHVDSIQAGTGARFSLIPPENATGSYIKVVQRLPVKIVFSDFNKKTEARRGYLQWNIFPEKMTSAMESVPSQIASKSGFSAVLRSEASGKARVMP